MQLHFSELFIRHFNMKYRLPHLLSLLVTLVLFASCSTLQVYDLTCEGFNEPLGIDSDTPHFSWKTSCNKPMTQKAYQIEVASTKDQLLAGEADLWQSGLVESADQIRVPYAGTPLTSRQQGWWRVRIWNDDKLSKWSAPQHFGIGILDQIKGQYIGATPGKSSLLRKKFHVVGDFSQALLYVNSLGYHEVYLNGQKVSEAVLTPAVSQLSKHSLIVTYDVTKLLKDGENDLVLWTSAGWYRKHFNAVYDGAVVCAELDIDGKTALTTDATWLGRESGYRDIGTWIHDDYTGECINAMLVPKTLTGEALDTLLWTTVDTVTVTVKALPQMCELCTVHETFSAVSVKPYGENMWIADMGRVVNGLPEITLPQLPAGHETTVGFSDTKFDDGTVFTFLHNTYISSGAEDGDTFVGKCTQQAYQYLVFVNLPVAPKPEDIKVNRMRTDYPRRATFSCSDTDLCAIHDMVAYTMENLAFNGYMVDCGSLEKHGYGGDGNASTLAVQTLYEVAPLYYNWLQAWNDVVREDGSLPNTAPSTHPAGGGPYWCSFIIQAPWRTYMSYADDRNLAKGYPYMQQWLTFAEQSIEDGLYFRSTNGKDWGLGDWLAPKGVDAKDRESIDLVNNCAMSQCLHDMVHIAAHLGMTQDSVRYAAQLGTLNHNIHQTFYHGNGIYGTGSQIDMAYPLLVGAVPDSLVAFVESVLLERTEKLHNNHIACGLVGVPVLTEWATLAGKCNFIYRILKQPDYPGYLFMKNSGASAVWESWNGERSRLHNCYNGIGSWFYQAVGGIIPTEPGYKRVSICPQTPDGLTWSEVTEETPYGTLRVRWDRKKEKRILKVSIPVGITADIFGKTHGNGTYKIVF